MPPDDPDAHARALSRLLADDELAARMGRAGREAVERGDLVFERQAERLSALYARVAG